MTNRTRKLRAFEVTITKRRVMWRYENHEIGRRTVYDAEFGRLSAQGFPSAAEAAAEIRAQIEHLAANPYPIEHRDAKRRRWVLRATPDGWEYFTPPSGRSHGCVCMMPRTTSEQDALASMVEHARQYCEGEAAAL